MREYLNKISDLIPQLEKSSTFEEVMKNITHFSFSNLGNRENAKKGENLKEGELDQYACGSFILINKDKQILIGPQNYAKEQEYMILDTNIGHPGWVIENKKRLILQFQYSSSLFGTKHPKIIYPNNAIDEMNFIKKKYNDLFLNFTHK